MYTFVVSIRPKSYNRKKKDIRYELLLQAAFKQAYPEHLPVGTDLYGLVYHFFNSDIGIDADNLSKPVWDSLAGIIFEDDRQIKMRIAGSFDLSANDFNILDFTGLSGDTVSSLLSAMVTEEHVIYVECGRFATNQVRLNLEGNGN